MKSKHIHKGAGPRWSIKYKCWLNPAQLHERAVRKRGRNRRKELRNEARRRNR